MYRTGTTASERDCASAELLTQGRTGWSLSANRAPAMLNALIVVTLARCFLAGEANTNAICDRARAALGKNWPWLRPLARRYVARFPGPGRPRRREVEQFLRRDRGLAAAQRKHQADFENLRLIGPEPTMQPIGVARSWNVPAIASSGELAGWLGLEPGELEWFANLRDWSPPGTVPLNHYSYAAAIKRSGAIRLIEAPKTRLKTIQRRILAEILDRIPAHPAAHGFAAGRSIRTFAAPHVGGTVVLRMDLQDFFPSMRAARVQAFFRTAGYPELVADLLGGLCTHATHRRIWKGLDLPAAPELIRDAQVLYSRRHVPQGAPTSPALANLCAWRIDSRLTGLARSAGAIYTRYADDLAFSGGPEFARGVERFSIHVAAILLEEGFHAHHRKTRILHRGVRQYLAGVVINDRINPVRADVDRLRAILHNCALHGPNSQNRDNHPDFRNHLRGSVAFIESLNPQKGARLRTIFDRIHW